MKRSLSCSLSFESSPSLFTHDSVRDLSRAGSMSLGSPFGIRPDSCNRDQRSSFLSARRANTLRWPRASRRFLLRDSSLPCSSWPSTPASNTRAPVFIMRLGLLSGASSKAQPTELAPTSRPSTNLGDACLSIVESLLDKFKKGDKLLLSIPKRRL